MTKVILQGYIIVPSEDLQAVQEELPMHIQRTQQEEGCLVFEVHQDQENEIYITCLHYNGSFLRVGMAFFFFWKHLFSNGSFTFHWTGQKLTQIPATFFASGLVEVFGNFLSSSCEL